MRLLLTTSLRLSLGGRQWAAPVWAVLLALVVAGLFVRLGYWQLERAAEKAGIAARYGARSHVPALGLPALLAKGGDVEEWRVRLGGHYDNSRTLYLENQPHGGRAGFHIYTVFLPDDGAPGILVNRGWVPVDADMQRLPAVPTATATWLTGRAALPSPYFTVGEPDYGQRPLRVGRLEMGRLEAALGVELRPFIIRLDAEAPDGFVREWAPAARLGMPPEKHRAYAFQWFSLAAAVLVVLIVVNLRKSPEPS